MKYASRTPIRDQGWLDHIKTERCLFTGVRGTQYEGIDPFHIGTRGRGLKSSDDEVLPIRHSYHQLSHSSGEVSFLRKHAPDDVIRMAFRALARELYTEYLRERGQP